MKEKLLKKVKQVSQIFCQILIIFKINRYFVFIIRLKMSNLIILNNGQPPEIDAWTRIFNLGSNI